MKANKNKIRISSIQIWYNSYKLKNVIEFHFDENDKCEYKIRYNSFKNKKEEKSFIFDFLKYYCEYYVKKLENHLVDVDNDEKLNNEEIGSKKIQFHDGDIEITTFKIEWGSDIGFGEFVYDINEDICYVDTECMGLDYAEFVLHKSGDICKKIKYTIKNKFSFKNKEDIEKICEVYACL